MATTSITGYTKAQQDVLLAGKVDAPDETATQGQVPTVNAEGGIDYTDPAGGDPAKKVAPAFVFTWDDGDDTVYDEIWPIFVAEGIAGTLFLNCTKVDTTNCVTWAEVEEMNTKYLLDGTGIEIQDHQYQHDYFDPTTPAAATGLADTTETGITTLRSHGILADYLAYPGHRLNKRGQEIARAHYLGARGGSDATNKINTIHNIDLFHWGGTGFDDSTKLTKAEDIGDSIEARIEQLLAKESGGYVVGCLHSTIPGRLGVANARDATWVQNAINMVQAAGIRIISFSQANHEMASRGYLTTRAGAIAP